MPRARSASLNGIRAYGPSKVHPVKSRIPKAVLLSEAPQGQPSARQQDEQEDNDGDVGEADGKLLPAHDAEARCKGGKSPSDQDPWDQVGTVSDAVLTGPDPTHVDRALGTLGIEGHRAVEQ